MCGSGLILLLCFITAVLNSAGMGLVNSLGPGVTGGQANSPNLTPPSQIDPSSIERAYAALGLTYQGNQMAQQPPQANMPNQGLPSQPGIRPLNTMGELAMPFCKHAMGLIFMPLSMISSC